MISECPSEKLKPSSSHDWFKDDGQNSLCIDILNTEMEWLLRTSNSRYDVTITRSKKKSRMTQCIAILRQ